MVSTPRNMPIVETAVRTDPGRDPEKQINEDGSAYAETALGLLAVVCDGMGGHAGGKEASELAVRTILELVQAAPETASPRVVLGASIEEANRRVWAMSTQEGGHRPGSTVVAVLVHHAGAEVAHVGDSRVYLVHSGAITQLTRDHSMVQEMVDRRLIKAEDASSHPEANKIMRALGIAKAVEVDLRPEPLSYVAGDVLVLCTDGLSDLVSASDILAVAGSKPPAQAAGQLVDLANARGGHDNITSMVLRLKSSASAHDALPITKTIALTEVFSPRVAPTARGSRTLLEAPVAPVAPMAGAERNHLFHSDSRSHGSPMLRLAAGVVVAVLALAAAAAVVYLEQRSRHHTVTVVEQEAAAPSRADEADAAPAGITTPEITASPALAPPSGVRVPWWHDADAPSPASDNKDCTAARVQKEQGKPASSYATLEAKCRAAGGRP